MASEIYRGYLVIARASRDELDHAWLPVADVSFVIEDWQRYATREEATEAARALARKFVDNRASFSRLGDPFSRRSPDNR